jgi:hypothetical protein
MAETRKTAAGRQQQDRHPAVQGDEAPEPTRDNEQDRRTAQQAKTQVGAPAGSGDQGPGTRQPQPDEDQFQRGQARMHIGAGHQAAPIEAPDAATQEDPEEGHSRSSTNPVAALVGRTTIAGENHVQFVDSDGGEVAAGDLFEDAGADQTYRVARQTVYEVFNYQGSTQPMTRLLFPAGYQVDLATAARLEDAQRLGQAQLRQEEELVGAEVQRFHAPSGEESRSD